MECGLVLEKATRQPQAAEENRLLPVA